MKRAQDATETNVRKYVITACALIVFLTQWSATGHVRRTLRLRLNGPQRDYDRNYT